MLSFKFFYLCHLIFLISPFVLIGTDFAPWYPRYLELQPQISYNYQSYKKLNTKQGLKHTVSRDHLLNFSLAGAYRVYAVEIENNCKETSHSDASHHSRFADIRLTGRYQLLDDVVGDPVSLTMSLTGIQASQSAVKDISYFYHGLSTLEGHVSIGKEIECREYWLSRLFTVVGVGLADRGSPYVRGHVVWEHNGWDKHIVTVFTHTLWGLGSKNLNLNQRFHGYGSIKHHSIDTGIKYTYILESGLTMSAHYARRCYSLNCPHAVNFLGLTLLYPFGL